MTVLSSLLPCADLDGEALRIVVVVRESGSAKRFQAEGVFSALGWQGCRSVVVATRQNRPGNTGKLVGHGHDDDVRVSPGIQST